MDTKLSLLAVGMANHWENSLKGQERGYHLCQDGDGRYTKITSFQPSEMNISYPHGPLRAGFNAIADTLRIAHETGKTNYALIEPNEENVCNSIQPYIHKKNIFIKKDPTGFGSDDLRKKILEEECTHLMVLGYDRDDFVLDAIKDALESDVEVVTSEEIMLTSDLGDRRRKSLKFFRGNTAYLENLVDVFNYILEH